MQNFIHTQLETCHANNAGDAIYAYFHEEPSKADWDTAKKSKCPGGIGLDEADEWENREEVPTKLSRETNVKRYYLGSAG